MSIPKEFIIETLATVVIDHVDDCLQATIRTTKMSGPDAIDFYNEGIRGVIAKLQARLEGKI